MPGRDTGFTLIESMMAMAVLAILVAIGIPAFKATLERQRARTATHLLSAQFASARSVAISHRTPTTVCPSADGLRCTEGTDWSRGWIMYRDPGRTPQPASAASVLRWENRPASGATRLLSSPGRRLIRFLPDGRSAGTNLSVRVCSDERFMAEIVVNNLGRVRTSRPTGNLPCGR
ncbi:GspH/FimT family pseudopilin [Pseudomonas sp. Hp2]|uniref:GspH/FimT family pseudopilin n=1 Tax=Pseudomonas sp. Hp2 TaxID=701189 RepID=UPI00112EC1FE|nr:Tfp pilus assembly protein FimT/FimU [Pseudomonas sp. Hp2]